MAAQTPPPVQLSITSFLEKVPIGSEEVSTAPVPQNVIRMRSDDNRSLQLAERERFMDMCQSIRWGSESEWEFGEFLRSAILEFLPASKMQLTLLRNIVSIQWKIQRLEKMQKNVFEHGTQAPGKYNLPESTHNAQEIGADYSRLLSDLKKAIDTYNAMTSRNKR